MSMNWITSDGGPLVLVEDKSLNEWQGIDGSDYDRACAIDDYLGSIEVGNSLALVLGDEPCQTAVYHSVLFGVIFVRWQWAENEISVQVCLDKLTNSVFDELVESLDYVVKNKYYKLFDAASSGSEASGMAVALEEDIYIVQTARYEPDEKTSLILHRFLPKTTT